MSRWFRHYAGMMADPKFGGVARLCKRSRAEVLFAWGVVLESAAEGASAAYEWDADMVGELLGIDTAEAQAIHDAMVTKGLLSDGQIASWDRLQFTSDDSTQRVRAHRERRKTARNVDETLHATTVTPPETETETDSESRTEAKAPVLERAKPRPTKLCPAAWSPTDEDRAAGEAIGFTPGEIERELAKFRDHEFRTPHAAWSQTFRNWLRTAADRNPSPAHDRDNRISPRPSAPDSRRANTDARRNAWLEVVAERDGKPPGGHGDGGRDGGTGGDGGRHPVGPATGHGGGNRDGDRIPCAALPSPALQRG